MARLVAGCTEAGSLALMAGGLILTYEDRHLVPAGMVGWKITGPGQRATLSAMLGEGMKAVTIRVNDVEGVAGFVLPGDRVDIVLTRSGEKNNAVNDVVIQDVRVLAVDQLADQRADKPSVVKAVTIEVDPTEGQKVALAATVGTLSLLLRKAGDAAGAGTMNALLNTLHKDIVKAQSRDLEAVALSLKMPAALGWSLPSP